MSRPRLGASLHTLSREWSRELLDAVARSRIATLEVLHAFLDGDGREDKAIALKECLRQGSARVMTIHAPFGTAYDLSAFDRQVRQDAIAAVNGAIDLALELEAPMIVVHASAEPIGLSERQDRLAQAQSALVEIGRRCEEEGVRVAIELLPRSCLGNRVEELVALLNALPDNTFGVCLDTNHLMDRYQHLARDVCRLGDRLLTLHLSDYDGVDEQHGLPGSGVLDWRSFMAALGDIHYRGPFNYECKITGETPEQRIRTLEENFHWLAGLASG